MYVSRVLYFKFVLTGRDNVAFKTNLTMVFTNLPKQIINFMVIFSLWFHKTYKENQKYIFTFETKLKIMFLIIRITCCDSHFSLFCTFYYF